MKTLSFASRNTKELVRDPLNCAFSIGFPVILLLLLSAIQANIPVSLFKIEKLSPGIAVFGLSFISLFSATLISKDRSSSFLMRLFASPMPSSSFILGYVLPLLPLSIAQILICFITAFILGLSISLNVLVSILTMIPAAVLFIAIGLLCGSIFNEKQVGGICGAVLTNVTAWLSGTWFDLKLVGSGFKNVSYALPFAHAVDASRAAINGDYAAIWPHFAVVSIYALIFLVIAVIVFKLKMDSDKV